MTNRTKAILTLSEYREQRDLINLANKRIAELKKEILEKYGPGVYGDLVLTIEEREVQSYTVNARIDTIIKIASLRKA